MKLTGKQLFEMWELCALEARSVGRSELRDAWDALADKLNGMMAGVAGQELYERWTNDPEYLLFPRWEELFETERARWNSLMSSSQDGVAGRESPSGLTSSCRETDSGAVGKAAPISDRGRHHATCPYRHGKGPCEC